jgi:hypothetical protein
VIGPKDTIAIGITSIEQFLKEKLVFKLIFLGKEVFVGQ